MTFDESRHELDDRLADSTLFGWLGPAFALGRKHWQLCLIVGVVAFGLEWLFAILPPVPGLGPWFSLLVGYAELLAYALVTAVGYRFLAAREKVGTVNEWPAFVLRVVQVQAIWMVPVLVVVGVPALLLFVFGSQLAASISGWVAWAWVGRLLGIVAFLLMPIWVSVGVAALLSDVYAVRSSESGWGAVKSSLRLAFDQKWRVFWFSYVLVLLAAAIYVVVASLGMLSFPLLLLFAIFEKVGPVMLAVPMMFVLERAYAPHLTMPGGAEPDAELPSRPPPWTVPPPPRVRTPPAPPAPLPSAPNAIAHRLAEDMRTNRMQQLVETVEHGLKADPRFFVAHADETLAVARRLANAKRADLALRVAQPYLKEHRAHRQHLAVALHAANLLLRDLGRKADAARFLGQVKTLYPNEPMVDQLIKLTEKAIAEGAGAA